MRPLRPRQTLGAEVFVTALVLPLSLSCSHEEQEGEVSDPQGCRTIILPEPIEDTSLPESTSESGPRCGDGNVDPGEQCDNGLANGEGNACNVECRFNGCGDGELGDPEIEECDDGNIDDTDACTSKCKNARCGDGKVWAGVEECDEGAGNADDQECTSECTINVCGDGKTLAGIEACDDGNQSSEDACLNTCEFAACGDGLVWEGMEACDDGNASNEDECLNSCELAICGDGYVWDGEEECDDGNTDAADGCSATCKVEVRTVFVTSVAYAASLGGLNGADAKCQERANFAGLRGTYMAWLSDNQSGPSTRFGVNPSFQGRFHLVDGTVVAEGWSDLTDGSLLHAIDQNEVGTGMLNAAVWTNTGFDGIPAGGTYSDNCYEWMSTSSAYNGRYGQSTVSGQTWSAYSSASCSGNNLRLYCFQVQ